MSLPVVVVLLGAAALAARALRRRERERAPRPPKPGEGMPRQEQLMNPPGDGMVKVRSALHANEAHVVYGLLVAAGVRATLQAYRDTPFVHKTGAIPNYDLYVAADRVAEAEALLASEDERA